MKFRILLGLSLMGLLACNPSKDKKVDQTTLSFQTDDSSKLYFKNVRQNSYDVQVMEEAKLEVYRYKKRIQESDAPILNLALINNWRYDEAYVLLEPNTAAGNLNEIELRYENESGESGSIAFIGGNKQNHLDFAFEVYEQIQNESQFKLIRGDRMLDVLSDSKSREAFRITMLDYFRLVRSL